MNGNLTRWLIALALFAVVVIAVVVTQVSNKQVDSSPLGPYPTQRVTNRVPGVPGPAARYGETMVIEGKLCSKAKHDVPVLTTLGWQAPDHTGTFVTVAIDIHQTRQPGCETFTGTNAFHNPMPTAVIEATRVLRAQGVAHVRWVVSGFEVPVLPNGSEGVRQEFTSERFEVVP